MTKLTHTFESVLKHSLTQHMWNYFRQLILALLTSHHQTFLFISRSSSKTYLCK